MSQQLNRPSRLAVPAPLMLSLLCLLSVACGARSMDASMSAGGAAPNMEGGAMMDHAEPSAPVDHTPPAPADSANAPVDGAAGTAAPECTDAELEPETLYLSADDSNSQASAPVAARLIRDGRLVPGYMVRPGEILNHHAMGYTSGDALQVIPQARAVPGRERAWSLQIGVVAPALADADRRPLNLTLLIDTSGSMAGTPIDRAQDTIRALAHSLREGDIVSVVSFDIEHRLLLDGHRVTQPDDPALLATLELLRPNNRTDLSGALAKAYELARRDATPERLSRVVLISDGNTNTGEQDIEQIGAAASDAESGAIFLVGVAVGDAHGLNFHLMDRVTDAGKGAFVYVDSKAEADRLFGPDFLANMEVAALDVRVKLVLPPGFSMERFHGEQISTVAEEVDPQHLAPNDAMIYHQVINNCQNPSGSEVFVVEATFTDPASGEERTVRAERTLDAMLQDPSPELRKGDALVAFAEALQEVDEYISTTPEKALEICQKAHAEVATAALDTGDAELASVAGLLERYCNTVQNGELINGVCDCSEGVTPEAALGLCQSEHASGASIDAAGDTAVAILSRLRDAGPSLGPREGCRMLALSSGAVGEANTTNSTDYGRTFQDPAPAWNGDAPMSRDGASIHDRSTLTVTLTAPEWAKSFSFDFVYLSAEFPHYVGSHYNDTFYAIIEAQSTHDGEPTNISFDGNGRSIEINNNYFQNPFHPCWEFGSGFDQPNGGGSTCWLQTSWPIQGGETFTLTFTIHDEGDGVYASQVMLDNFQWHRHEAVGATDPI